MKPLVQVVHLSDDRVAVISAPHPLAGVVIVRRESGLWVPRPHWPFCVDYMPRDRDLMVPIRAAERAVTRRARELFDAFTGTQRTVMGRDRRCPYLSSAGVCRALPDVGTVWCPRHRGRYTL